MFLCPAPSIPSNQVLLILFTEILVILWNLDFAEWKMTASEE